MWQTAGGGTMTEPLVPLVAAAVARLRKKKEIQTVSMRTGRNKKRTNRHNNVMHVISACGGDQSSYRRNHLTTGFGWYVCCEYGCVYVCVRMRVVRACSCVCVRLNIGSAWQRVCMCAFMRICMRAYAFACMKWSVIVWPGSCAYLLAINYLSWASHWQRQLLSGFVCVAEATEVHLLDLTAVQQPVLTYVKK